VYGLNSLVPSFEGKRSSSGFRGCSLLLSGMRKWDSGLRVECLGFKVQASAPTLMVSSKSKMQSRSTLPRVPVPRGPGLHCDNQVTI